MLGKLVMHLYEYDTFAIHRDYPVPISIWVWKRKVATCDTVFGS
ncbi:unnamed protein product [Amoebophrya sp. A120]|nr:unnamed protein product [Amoebophrya sp. A120]|eukprot:GSA120T00010113001.1